MANTKLRNTLYAATAAVFALVAGPGAATAQNFSQFGNTANFREAQAIIRVAEASQLADTVLVWGDVSVPGTYLVPRGTKLMEMLSYAKGPSRYTSTETVLDWSKLRVSVVVSPAGGGQSQKFSLRYDSPLDPEFRNLPLSNFDVIALEVKRKPAFADYVRVIAPVISAVATSVLVVRNIQGL